VLCISFSTTINIHTINKTHSQQYQREALIYKPHKTHTKKGTETIYSRDYNTSTPLMKDISKYKYPQVSIPHTQYKIPHETLKSKL